MCSIWLDGFELTPAKVDAACSNVFLGSPFVLCRPRWVADSEMTYCFLCKQGFNQLRRKHHCRQCGQIICKKCCAPKVALPHLQFLEPEKVCNDCHPIALLISNSRSNFPTMQIDSVQGISKLCESARLPKLIELGGLQTLVYMAAIPNLQIRTAAMSGLHTLTTHDPLLDLLVETGAIAAISCMLEEMEEKQEKAVMEGVGALMNFCQVPDLRTICVQNGVVPALLNVFQMEEKFALMAVQTLSMIVEDRMTHADILQKGETLLPQLITLAKTTDERSKEVTFKILATLSMNSDDTKEKIIQADYAMGSCMSLVWKSHPKNVEVLINAACLLGNLSVVEHCQTTLQVQVDDVCNLPAGYPSNIPLLGHVFRTLANFSKYPANAHKLVYLLPTVIAFCIKSPDVLLQNYGLRIVFNVLQQSFEQTTDILLSDRESVVMILHSLTRMPSLLTALDKGLLESAPEQATPQ